MTTGNWLAKRIQVSRPHQERIWSEGVNDLTIISRPGGRKLRCSTNKEYVDFMSCSYLGLEMHPALINAAKEGAERFGVQYAAARTRAKCSIFDELEEKLNRIFMDSHTVIFNSVGSSHLAVLPILGSGELPGYPISEKGLVWVLDKTTHASVQILRGILEQFGPCKRISFYDQEKLYETLEECKKNNLTPILISDSLGSMGGSHDVKLLTQLAKEFGGYYYVDDAHGTSIIGTNGCGYSLYKLGEFKDNLILLSSLAKAFGSHGGSASFNCPEAVACIKRYALNYIFAGGPALPGIAACVAAADIHLSPEIDQLQRQLQHNIDYFDNTIKNVEVKDKLSPIRTISIGCENEAIRISKELREKGFLTTAALYPTVAKSQSIIRVGISSAHTEEELSSFAATMNELTGQLSVVS